MSKRDFYGGLEPEKAPAYSVREVADFLQLPKSTVRSWTFGTTYTAQDGSSRPYRPVIRPADKIDVGEDVIAEAIRYELRSAA